jgi:hypothetical protein
MGNKQFGGIKGTGNGNENGNVNVNVNGNIFKNVNCTIASYIMDMDIENLIMMLDLEYCNKLVVLISKILNQRYSNHELKEIVKIINPSIKSEYSLEISKFYVKIGHLFSVILTTINENKNFNQTLNKDQTGGCGENRIPELIDLYNDSGYDLNTGNFLSMTSDSKIKFNNDLKDFYIAFTQNKEIPDSITKFSDIPLYQSFEDQEEQEDQEDQQNHSVIIEYANNLKKILLLIENTHKKLLEILNVLFESSDDNKVQICINSIINENILQQLLDKTRNIIFEFYLNYDEYYFKNTKLYEAIVLSQIIETSKNQMRTLEDEKFNLLNSTFKKG